MSTRLVARALWLTAALNLPTGVLSTLFPALNAAIFLAPGPALAGVALRYHVMFWGFVAVMGVGYAAAARDPERQTALVLAGGLGKLVAVAVWAEMVTSGVGRPILLGAMAFDGALGVLFVAFAAPRLLGRETAARAP